jgi:hypothetical protein
MLARAAARPFLRAPAMSSVASVALTSASALSRVSAMPKQLMSARSVTSNLHELRRAAPASLVARRFKSDHHAKDAHHHPRPTQDEWGQPIEYDEHGEKITRAPVWFMEDVWRSCLVIAVSFVSSV